LGIDLPCSTWSRARRAPPGSKWPGPLRGDTPEEIWGRSDLSEKERNAVNIANKMTKLALACVRVSAVSGGSGYLENPASSRLWKLGVIQKLVEKGLAEVIVFDQCQYGTQWRKRTRLLVWGRLRGISLKSCCSKGGLCSRTGKPHVQLTGASGRTFRSAHAQVFPLGLGQAMFEMIHAMAAGSGKEDEHRLCKRAREKPAGTADF